MVFSNRFFKLGAIAAFSLLLAGCQPKAEKDAAQPGPVQRYASVTGLKADKLDYYKALHAEAWPAVLSRIKDVNIRNYSIYLKQVGEEYLLFSYFEYVGNDSEADMQKMAEDPETQRWWQETDPCQQPLPEAAAKGEIWSAMEEVFHTD